MPEGQKRAPDLITDGCEPPCGCWELNSGPLEEQAMLLTAEPSLQPIVMLLLHVWVFFYLGHRCSGLSLHLDGLFLLWVSSVILHPF